VNNRKKGDVKLVLTRIPVNYASGASASAVAEGNNARWDCHCGSPLLGRCYFQFGHDCHTTCPCGTAYRVIGDSKKKAVSVVELTVSSRNAPQVA
jgi:hypothetical protein